MAHSRHKAIVAGLALTLTLGSTAPALATLSDETPTTDTDPNGVGAPLPSDYDKTDFYEGQENVRTFAKVRSASRLAPLKLSDEMKYFAQFESHGNYDQGLSYGDGYNAMGFYQFDRRYSLMGFIQQVYSYDSTKYAMFRGPLEHADTLSSKTYSMYDSDTRQLTGLAQDLNEAWHAAYKADPEEFSALQDAYAYNNYYLPVQSILLNSYGVDVRDRADCVKGLVWGMCNMFGSGGVRNYFKDANLNDDMTDRELVTALCDTVVNRVSYYCSSQPQYWTGWQNRYKKEKQICLTYIAEDEAQQNAADKEEQEKPSTPVTPETPSKPATPSTPETPTTPPASDTSSDSGKDNAAGNAAGSSNGNSSSIQVPSNGVSNGGTANMRPNGSTGDAAQLPSDDSNNGNDQADQGSNAGGTNGSTANDANGNTEESKNPTKQPDSQQSSDATDDEGDEAGEAPVAASDNNGDKKDEATKDQESGVGKSAAGESKPDDGKKAADEKTDKDSLPQTGDIAGIVLTGAAGLAMAGGSFVSLSKKERDEV